MNIGIDARMYGPQQGGIGRYIEQLIHHLILIDRDNTYTFFVHPDNPIPSIPTQHTIIETPFPWYSIAEQTHLPRIMNESNCDIIHFPHWNVPLFLRKPFITTIHDLILLHYPDRRASTLSPLRYRIKYKAFRYILAHAAKNARHILTVSNFSKLDIEHLLNAQPQHITTTHLGFSALTHHTTQIPQKKPFMLAVGVHYPHKNHQLLLDIFPRLNNHLSDINLIIAGPHGPFTKDLEKRIKRTNDECTHKQGRIFLQTNLSDAELSSLYAQAEVLLFPSLYEGFGLPPLEAMAHGTPVIASNASSMPEICGTAALMASPTQPKEWIDAITNLLADQRLKQTLISRGHMRCSNFSWNTCAQSTLNVYKTWSK